MPKRDETVLETSSKSPQPWTVFGRQTTKSTDWFVMKNAEELTPRPLITKNRKVLEMYKSCPSQQNLEALWGAQGDLQRIQF